MMLGLFTIKQNYPAQCSESLYTRPLDDELLLLLREHVVEVPPLSTYKLFDDSKWGLVLSGVTTEQRSAIQELFSSEKWTLNVTEHWRKKAEEFDPDTRYSKMKKTWNGPTVYVVYV